MPTVYYIKNLCSQWQPDNLIKAIADIKEGVFTVRAASRAYGIPCTTLQQYANAKTRQHQLSNLTTILTSQLMML